MIVADTHVHVYPFARLEVLLGRAVERLEVSGPGEARALFLTERYDCSFFEAVTEGRVEWPSGWRLEGVEGLAAGVKGPGDERLWLVSGFQVVTAEKVEVLGLGLLTRPKDGEGLEDTLARIREGGGMPVLSWAPGKWLGRRGELVGKYLGEVDPRSVLIGDTSLRPVGWPTPSLFIQGISRGIRVVHGSDPLPVAGDEGVTGSFASRFDLAWEDSDPEGCFRRALLDREVKVRSVGRRSWPWGMGRRFVANEVVRRRGGR